MFARLLIPLDGSLLAETALPAAKVLAKRYGAELCLVRAEYPLVSAERASSEKPLPSQLDVQTHLDGLVQHLTAEGITAHTVLLACDPAEGILAQADLDRVDLIVMATHGRTGFDALLHPSITWQVFSRTSAPVLVCRGVLQKASVRTPTPLPHFMADATAPLVVPLDGSLQAEAALPLAQQLAQTFGNPVRIVRVVPYPIVMDAGMGPLPLTEEMITWSLAEAEFYLKLKQAAMKSQGLKVEIESAMGIPASCLEACVQDHHAGLVVMTSHGRGWFGRLVLGSVAKHLLGHLDAPILLVRLLPAAPATGQHQTPAEVWHANEAP